jgi:hypothetical protein
LLESKISNPTNILLPEEPVSLVYLKLTTTFPPVNGFISTGLLTNEIISIVCAVTPILRIIERRKSVVLYR